MSNVFTFPAKPAMPSRAAVFDGAPKAEPVAEMVQQSAVMQLVSTLAFYAKGGFDHGKKAQEVLPAVREILASRGIALTVNLNP